MNQELKAMLGLVFQVYKLISDVVEKKGSEVADLASVAMALPAVISNLSDFQAEVEALKSSGNISDLVAFVSSQFAGVVTSDAHAIAILDAAMSLVGHLGPDSVALYQAIKG